MNLCQWFKNCFISVALLSYLMLGLAGVRDIVLCIEPDGHMALETAQNGVCADRYERIETVALNQHHAVLTKTRHKPCQDIPLSFHNADNKAEVAGFSVGTGELAVLPDVQTSAFNTHLETVTANLLSHPPPAPPPLHRFLDTVILVI